MNEDSIRSSLIAIFEGGQRWPHEGRRLVFWYDPRAEFTEVFENLELPGIQKLKLSNTPFTHKHHLLKKDPQSPYLVYAPFEEPPPRQNWLYDLQATGLKFSADRAAMLWRELGLHDRSLEEYLRDHLRFFASKERHQALLDVGILPEAKQADLQLAMLCVLAKIKVADGGLLVRRLLMGGLEEAQNPLWLEITKFFTTDEIWQSIRLITGFGLASGEVPNLRRLGIALAVTHMERRWKGSLPKALEELVIRPGNFAFALVDTWLKDRQDNSHWAEFCKQVEDDLNITEIASDYNPDAFEEVDTFEGLEKAMLRWQAQSLLKNDDLEQLARWQQIRKTSYWYEKYQPFYAAIEAATQLFNLKRTFSGEFPAEVTKLRDLYAASLHRIDRGYRSFVEVYQDIQGAEGLRPLSDAIENFYVNEFLENLGQAWSDALKRSGETWPPEGFRTIKGFFTDYVLPTLSRNDREKVFVIISDALRYEIASEMQEQIKLDLRGEPELGSLLTELPGVTPLGMAALLPGKTLEWKPDGSVLRDGLPTNGTVNRQKVLGASGFAATAIQSNDLVRMDKEAGRAAVQPYRLIYIYHNLIDSMGESLQTENRTFQAAREAVTELCTLIRRLVNQLNATHIVVTADHGFLFQRKVLEGADKLTEAAAGEVWEKGRRYMVGNNLSAPTGTLRFTMRGLEGTPQVVVPRGSLRFTAPGGMLYVHGGASLQEAVVPVLTYKHVRAQKGDDGASQKVRVAVNTGNRRITNRQFSLSLTQAEPIGGRIRSRRIKIGFYDSEGNAVTDERQLQLESPSEAAVDRTQTIILNVTGKNLNRTKSYDLVIRDSDDGTEVLRDAWRIDIALDDEFGF